jgi:hypothetical protein
VNCAEFYKYAPQSLLALLWVALKEYLRGKSPSVCAHEWIGAIEGYIPKKLSALLITEFRMVASICTKFMIFLEIIDIRLDHVTEEYVLIDDEPEHFRQGRSTKRSLAKSYCMLEDQSRKKKGTSVLLYLDIVKTFNPPNYRAILFILEAQGILEADIIFFVECTLVLFWLWSILVSLECHLPVYFSQGFHRGPLPDLGCFVYYMTLFIPSSVLVTVGEDGGSSDTRRFCTFWFDSEWLRG